jgi:hypothetical protein
MIDKTIELMIDTGANMGYAAVNDNEYDPSKNTAILQNRHTMHKIASNILAVQKNIYDLTYDTLPYNNIDNFFYNNDDSNA